MAVATWLGTRAASSNMTSIRCLQNDPLQTDHKTAGLHYKMAIYKPVCTRPRPWHFVGEIQTGIHKHIYTRSYMIILVTMHKGHQTILVDSLILLHVCSPLCPGSATDPLQDLQLASGSSQRVYVLRKVSLSTRYTSIWPWLLPQPMMKSPVLSRWTPSLLPKSTLEK